MNFQIEEKYDSWISGCIRFIIFYRVNRMRLIWNRSRRPKWNRSKKIRNIGNANFVSPSNKTFLTLEKRANRKLINFLNKIKDIDLPGPKVWDVSLGEDVEPLGEVGGGLVDPQPLRYLLHRALDRQVHVVVHWHSLNNILNIGLCSVLYTTGWPD